MRQAESLPIRGFVRRSFESDRVAAVEELRSLVDAEFGLDLGILRPDDQLDSVVIHPDAGLNPLRWLFYESWSREAANEVHFQLRKRLKAFGTIESWPRVITIGDLVLAWSGHRPPIGRK